MQTVNGIRIFGGNKFPESYPKRRVSYSAPPQAVHPTDSESRTAGAASLLAAPQVPPPQARARGDFL